MNDPWKHEALADDLFRNRIAAVLRELDQPESDADIAAALDVIEAEPLTDAATHRIMQQVQRSIAAHKPANERLGEPEGVSPRTSRDQRVRGLTPSGSLIQRIGLADSRSNRWAARLGIVVACTALIAVGLVFQRFGDVERSPIAERHRSTAELLPGKLISSQNRESSASSVAIQRVKLGETISTGAREKRRVTLLDGSVLSINEQSRVAIIGERRVKLLAGEVFVEVMSKANTSERFVVETPHRTVTALGTKFDVKAEEQATTVVVTQGKVQVSGIEDIIPAGQELIADLTESKTAELRPAKRSAYVVEWVKDLMAAAGSVVVPTSEHAGGTVTVVDPQGQEMKLSLRKFHVDVHIEEGFARTTIDQTYFNHTWQQLEGTFRFPLPADASLSRLAMYVNGKLMEGGMVERDYGRNVFEQIRHTRRDPALLEWVDGSTFQMRVFPLEPRQEKRILLSYTQRLPNDYGKSVYRFPAGHSLDGVREWSAHLRVKGEAGAKWYSPSHLLNGRDEQGDLVIDGREEHAALDRDLVVEFGEEIKEKPPVQLEEIIRRPMETIRGQPAFGSRNEMWSVYEQDGFQYVMLRYRPELAAKAERPSRQWIFLVENSADRNDLLAETQRQIVNVLLDNAEHSDTFSIIRAGTQSETFRRKPVDCSLDNVAAAQRFLQEVAPIGALDLEQALQSAQKQVRGKQEVWIVHLGTGIPVLGERDETTLLRLLPAKARYVGIAVGKRWSKSFMETAANHRGGHVTQINPDEAVAWRAFDLLSTLNAPRLTEIKVAITAPRDEPYATGDVGRKTAIRESNEKGSSREAMTATEPEWLLLTNSLAHGQELAAVTRFPKGRPLPKSILITGKLDGQKNQSLLEVPNATQCGHLPRTWTRLEIDRLVALGAVEHKSRIIELSKSMYVMSPFTSLLVLETEAMYEQFKVDRGRKDHWAMYPAPAEIPVVADQGPPQLNPLDAAKERLMLAQARAKSAQNNYERSVAEKRPAADLQRLDRLNRAEQAEVRLIEREIQRIERANAAAADPIRQAWESVVQRRSAWQQGYLQQARHHWNYWNTTLWSRPTYWEDFGWSSRPLNWSKDSGQRRGYFGDQSWEGFWNLNAHGNVSGFSFEAVNGRWDVRHSMKGVSPFDAYLKGYVGISDGVQSASTSSLSVRNDSFRVGNRIQPVWSLDGSKYVTPYDSALFDEDDEFTMRRFGRLPMLGSAHDAFFGGDITMLNSDLNSPSPNDWIERSSAQDSRFSAIRIVVPLADQDDFVTQLLPQQNWWRTPILSRNDFTRSSDDMLQFTPSHWGSRPLDFASGTMTFSAFDVDMVDERYTDGNFTTPLPRRFARDFGDVNNGGFLLPYVAGGSPEFDGWQSAYGRYGRYPVVAPHPLTGVLQDLPSYAPGLQTWPADRLAIVEAAAAKKPQRGEVDAEARRLIEKARSLGWEKVQLISRNALASGSKKLQPDASAIRLMLADGSGRFVFDREVGEGLKEQVIHDGTTLWHRYPEIGLGAKRTLSRFHQSAIQSLIPWYVPSADDLSVEADVKTFGNRTVRITRLKRDVAEVVRLRTTGDPVDDRNRILTNSATSEKPSTPAPHQIAFDLIFAEDGRLSESRVTDLTANKVLMKQIFAADGTIRLFDADDKLVAEVQYERQPIDAPNLVPTINDLVVLPLPYRSAAGVPVTVPVNLQTNAPDFAKLSDDDALHLLASYFAEARANELATFIEQRYTAQGDHRIGLAVLMASVNPQHALVTQATKQHPDLPLAKFLEQFARFPAQGDYNATLNADDAASPFLKRYCSIYNHYVRWATDRAPDRSRPDTEVQNSLNETLTFIRDCRSVDLAATLLARVTAGLKGTERMNATFARPLNDATAAMAEERGLPSFGRTARIEWLLTIGEEASVMQAKELFRSQLADAIVMGGVPELSGETRSAFVKHFKTPDGQPCEPWGELVKEAAQELSRNALASGSNDVPKPDASAFRLIAMARACASLREWTLAAAIFQLAIKDQDLNTQLRLNLAAFGYAKQVGDWAQAEACLQRALADEKLQKLSKLWRDAADVANQLRHFDDWIERLEHAYELEFAALPKTVNLEAFRKDYETLFGQFDQRAEQLADAKHSEKVAFARIVQRAASRWRDIDVDDTAACHRTATILAKLGLATAAWNYWTTPLAETPDRSTVWQTFATAMNSQQKFVVADRAWSTAFACEPTNPEILLQHAQFLRATRQEHKARELLTKITSSTWQPRFENTKQQAQGLLTGSSSPK